MAPAWLVWLLGGSAVVVGGLALAIVAREYRIGAAHRDLGGND